MARFPDVDVFLAVAEVGSFRGAAAQLSVTRSTVSRAIARLEEHLGTALFLRDQAHVKLTDAGVAYRRGAKRAAVALAEAERAARASRSDVSGTFRISASPGLYPGTVASVIAQFAQAYPDVQVDLVLTERVVHPIADDVEVAIRTGQRLQDSDLRSRKLADVPLVAVATPAVAEALPTAAEVPFLLFCREDRTAVSLPDAPVVLRPRFRSNDHQSLMQAARDGLGVAIASASSVADDVAAGRLVQVLTDWKLPRGKLWAVYPGAGRPTMKVRRFLDALVEGFAQAEEGV